jgi:TPR repeat protein
MGLLQVPFGILALMFVWTMYRKLWLFTLGLGLVYLAVIAFFNSAMPAVLNRDLLTMFLIAATSFAPFVLVALFGNYVYYQKAQGMIRAADRLFDEQLDKLVWIKNRAGGSATAAVMFMLLFGVSLTYYLPRSDLLSASFSLDLVSDEVAADEEAARKIRQQLEEASRLFEIAESHFNHSPPDFMKAEMAYSTAADNGSLLAAYKLGYMYYSGEGVAQSDLLALENFQRAVNAPLAFQPHSLELTTKFLAEAYNGLGVMYQNGYGTARNLPKAREMYLRGEEFGSANASRNLKLLYSAAAANQRSRLAEPLYN